ncbi:MAG: hypothetical protein ACFB2W_08550 [Leptolyngbyaceae cyanobacterium]
MAAFLPNAFRVAGVLVLVSSGMSALSTEAQLSMLELQSLEYRIDVPERGQIVTTPMTFTEFLDSEGFDYGAVVYLPTDDMENSLTLIHRDLNGDGLDDALVPLMVLPENEQQAQNDEGGYFALATVLNGQPPVHVYTTFFGMIYDIEQVDDQILVSGAVDTWGDEELFTYRWTETGLKETDREPINLDTIPFPDDREQYFAYENARFSGAVEDPLALTRSLLVDGDADSPSDVTLEVLATSAQKIVIGYSQQRLRDDSVYGKRLRLEFVPEGDLWRIDWMGQQFSCQPGRGPQVWHGTLCS